MISVTFLPMWIMNLAMFDSYVQTDPCTRSVPAIINNKFVCSEYMHMFLVAVPQRNICRVLHILCVFLALPKGIYLTFSELKNILHMLIITVLTT